MKTIPLTQGKVAIVDDEDFERINAYRWHFSLGYARRTLSYVDGKCKKVLMHREILDVAEGQEIDHINRNGCDNRKENLRLCSRFQNVTNTALQSRSTSGYKGVTFDKRFGKWQARIVVKRREIFLGYFTDPTLAASAYDDAARRYFGEFAKTNF